MREREVKEGGWGWGIFFNYGEGAKNKRRNDPM